MSVEARAASGVGSRDTRTTVRPTSRGGSQRPQAASPIGGDVGRGSPQLADAQARFALRSPGDLLVADHEVFLQEHGLRPVSIGVSVVSPSDGIAGGTPPRGPCARRRERCPRPSRTLPAPCATRGAKERNGVSPPCWGCTAARLPPIACAWSFGRDPNDAMNEHGHPRTLRAAQPGNRNAVKGGSYSARVRAERAEAIRAAATGTSTLALARSAVRDEVPRTERVREALDEDFAAWGPSTRAGAARGQVSQRSSVSRQLASSS